MIRILRRDCPASLQKPPNLIAEHDCGAEDVKAGLFEMQHGKCCYCERNLKELPPTEREVEHYVPKSSFKDNNGKIQWHLANAWQNLLYVCRTCNSRKSDKNPFNQQTHEREIIDPANEGIDPEEHIDFLFDDAMVTFKARDGSRLGASTIKIFRFSERKDLFRSFRRLMLEIRAHFIDLLNAVEDEDPLDIDSKTTELSKAMSAHLPFACFKRKFIGQQLYMFNEQILSKLGVRHCKRYTRILIYFPRGSEIRI